MRADPAGELGACEEEPSWELNLCCVSTDTSDRVSSDCEAWVGGSDGRLRARSADAAAACALPGRCLPSASGEDPRRSSCRRCCRSRSLLSPHRHLPPQRRLVRSANIIGQQRVKRGTNNFVKEV